MGKEKKLGLVGITLLAAGLVNGCGGGPQGRVMNGYEINNSRVQNSAPREYSQPSPVSYKPSLDRFEVYVSGIDANGDGKPDPISKLGRNTFSTNETISFVTKLTNKRGSIIKFQLYSDGRKVSEFKENIDKDLFLFGKKRKNMPAGQYSAKWYLNEETKPLSQTDFKLE